MTLYKTSHGKILADYRLPRQKKLYTNTSLWCCRYRSSGFCCSCWHYLWCRRRYSRRHYLWCRRRYSRRSSSRWRTWIKSKIKISTLFITQVFLLNQKCENYNLHSVNYFCTPEIWNYRGKKQVGYGGLNANSEDNSSVRECPSSGTIIDYTAQDDNDETIAATK